MATQFHTNPPALAFALSAIPSLPRPLLSRLVARAIERMDEIDGDCDLEEDNEDRGLDEGEPDFRRARRPFRTFAGPGCMISDPDFGWEERGEQEDGA